MFRKKKGERIVWIPSVGRVLVRKERCTGCGVMHNARHDLESLQFAMAAFGDTDRSFLDDSSLCRRCSRA